MSEATKALWVKCGACRHIWAGAHYPADVRAFAEAAKAAVCPNCGESERITIAKQADGELQEPAP